MASRRLPARAVRRHLVQAAVAIELTGPSVSEDGSLEQARSRWRGASVVAPSPVPLPLARLVSSCNTPSPVPRPLLCCAAASAYGEILTIGVQVIYMVFLLWLYMDNRPSPLGITVWVTFFVGLAAGCAALPHEYLLLLPLINVPLLVVSKIPQVRGGRGGWKRMERGWEDRGGVSFDWAGPLRKDSDGGARP